LREQDPQKQGAADDWVWVLRSTGGARSVLRWDDSARVPAAAADTEDADAVGRAHGLVELSSGADRPASVANSPVGPGTAFAYDVAMGPQARMLVAGQFSYVQNTSATGLAAEWLPTGDAQTGPVTTMVVRQSEFGPGGPVFRGVRISHENQLAIGDRLSLRYGGEFVYAGFGTGTSAVRPRAELALEMSPEWQLSVVMATHPWDDAPGDTTDALESAVDTFDAFPTLMMRHRKPVFENDMHEEVAVKRSMGDSAQITASVFHDHSAHTAVMGLGTAPNSEFVQGFFGDAFAYDGGETDSTGTRVVYDQKIADDLTSTVIYDYSGALAVDNAAGGARLRNQLGTEYRHSIATRIMATVPGANTKLIVGYKWLNGPVVSQQDAYGQDTYGVDPYLSMSLRQPLPSVFPGHMVVQADMGNILSQGSTTATAYGKVVVLVPAYRYFRGGLSFQF
jgi:hypothetical protein